MTEDENSPSMLMKNAETDDSLISYVGRIKDHEGYVELYRTFKGTRIIRNIKTQDPAYSGSVVAPKSAQSVESVPQ